jgi:two-component system, cell cycle sensor histidine kinase and response regulator CckA
MQKTRKNTINKSIPGTPEKLINNDDMLRIYAEQYHILTGTSMDGYWAVDLDGNLLDVNAAFCRMAGYSEDELLEMTIMDLVASETPDEVKEHIQEIINTGSDIFNSEIRHKDGRIITVEVSATYYRQMSRLMVFLRDIMLRKHAGETQHKANDTLLAMLNSLPVAIFDLDDNGVVKSIWNPAAEQMLGWTSKEALGHFLPSVQTESAKIEFKKFRDAVKSGHSVIGVDLSRNRKDGTPVQYSLYAAPLHNSAGDITGNIAMLLDITERKRSEEALALSESFLNNIINQSPYPIWISDNKGTLIRINKACLNLLNLSEEEVVGKYNIFEDNLVKEQGFIPLIKKVYESGETAKFELIYKSSELKNIKLEHSAFVILDVIIFPIRDAAGKITNAVIQHIDITERKYSEVAIRESEERYKELLDSVSDYIYSVKIEGGRPVATQHGPGCIAVTGYSPHEFAADPYLWYRMIHESDRNAVSEQTSNILSGKEAHAVEHRIIHKNGTIRWVRNTPVPRRIPEGKLVGYDGLISDITKRKEAEEGLSESENRFRKIFDESLIGIVIVSPSFAFEKVNPAFCSMMGYSADELINMKFIDITHPYYIAKDIENVKKVERGEMPFYHIEKQYIHKSGKVIWGDLIVSSIRDEQGLLCYYLSMINDITERKKAEEALRISEEKYRSIFERAVEGIFQSNIRGKFLNVNPSFASMLGYESPQEMLDSIQNIQKQLFVKAEEADFFTNTLIKAGTIFGFEHELYRKDGSNIWISVNAHAVKDKKGEIIYFEGISENISKRKQDEEEKERLHIQLRQAQKMEALGTFVGGIAHDFNNILSIIIGYSTLLQMELDNENPLRSYADLIVSSSEKAANLTQGLLAFSRKQPMNLKHLNLNDAIKGTEKLLKRLLTEDIILKKNFTKENTGITGDPTQIDQILFNLTTNARDAMPKGGILTIETQITELDTEFANVIGYGKPGKYVLLSISDTGTGIDKESREHIFDPFFTTKAVGKGTGLGLSTVYGIVKQHDGYISVNSEINAGTTFYVYFPSAKEQSGEKKKVNPKIRQGREKVIVAEDNEGVRMLIKRILSKYGYKIIEAVDGKDAIEKFRRTKKVDLVIIDSVMPKKNGREVYNEIIKINPDIKVLFTSGYTRDVILDKGIEEKEFDFISKPITPKKLLYKVGEILDRR